MLLHKVEALVRVLEQKLARNSYQHHLRYRYFPVIVDLVDLDLDLDFFVIFN